MVVVIGDYSRSDWPTTMVYVDGELEATTPGIHRSGSPAPIDTFNTRVRHPASKPLTFGNYGACLPSTAFRGELDEVIMVEGVLTPDQARALYEGRLKDSGIDLGR